MDTETIMQSSAESDLSAEDSTEETVAEEITQDHASDDISAAESLRELIIRRAEDEGIAAIYPSFDPDKALADPELGALLRGETSLSLRRLYEITHLDEIVETRVQSRMENAVAVALATALPTAVAAAVAEREEKLLSNIRARGQRPDENGTSAALGIRMHPAVDRLTRRERAMLAERAERGETIKL